MGKSEQMITTAEIEQLVRLTNQLYVARIRWDRDDAWRWRRERNETIKSLHRIARPNARRFAPRALGQLSSSLLTQMVEASVELADLTHDWEVESRGYDRVSAERQALQGRLEAFEAERQENAALIDALRRDLDQARAELARRTVSTVRMPERQISVTSHVQKEVLRLMAEEGLGRMWRLAAQVVAAGLAHSPNSARNAIATLATQGLVSDYLQHGKPVTWALRPGGTRRLVMLTDTGREWWRAAYGQAPVESEIAAIARKHHGVVHGVAILEARDLLRGAGYQVDDEPEPLIDGGERWGARAEPDLLARILTVDWPVEVQREVSERLIQKWVKTLQVQGRLMLVLFSKEAAQKQARILQGAYTTLPRGEIRCLSLEEMEAGQWEWFVLRKG
jgi:hypothetical protein